MKSNSSHPNILFSIVTLNEEKRIGACIKSIQSLNYPKSKIKIIVVDAGSKDKTISIVKKKKIKTISNPYKFADAGQFFSYNNFKCEYFVFMAADNVLIGKEWLNNMIKVFLENPDIIIAIPLLKISNKDRPISNYLNYDTDPFNSFFYFNGSSPRFFENKYKILKKTSCYKIYENINKEYPLIALAQGTMVNQKRFIRSKKKNFNEFKKTDDLVDTFINLKRNKKFAVNIKSYINHKSIDSVLSFYNKFDKRIFFSIKEKNFKKRENFFSFQFKIRKYLFLLLSVFPVYQMSIAIYRFIKFRQLFHFYYPLTAFIVFFLIFKNYIKIIFFNNNKR